jgi:hypothetical protein
MLALIGAVVAVVTFISMITSNTFRVWLKRHPYPIFVAFIVAILIIMFLLNYIRYLARRPSPAPLSMQQDPSPTEHDKQLFKRFAAALPAEGGSMRWLKQQFSPESIPREPMHALAEAVRKLDLNPIGFDDGSANAAYLELRKTIETFRKKVDRWTVADARHTSLDIPDEWRYENKEHYESALTEIREAHDVAVTSYDKFLTICHQLRLDS